MGKMTVYGPRRDAAEDPAPADTLVSDLRFQKVRE